MAKKRPAGELVIPPAALTDPKSVEMMRLWIADRRLHCALNIGYWKRHSGVEEDLAWGKVLADAVRHITNALGEAEGSDAEGTVRRIMKALEAELSEPMTAYRGRFVDPRNNPGE